MIPTRITSFDEPHEVVEHEDYLFDDDDDNDDQDSGRAEI
jgi:hypothetical protein